MRAVELIKRKPVMVNVGSSVLDAVKLMAENNVGLVVIVDSQESRRVLGVLSERDVIRALARGVDLSRARVEEVGTMGNIAKVSVYDYVNKVAQLMNERNIRHIVVVDDNDRVVGVISMRDILRESEAIQYIAKMSARPPTRE